MPSGLGEIVLTPDAAGMEEFCRSVSPRLVGALLLQCRDQAVAEDLAQEALARAWEHWPEVSTMDNPEGWVFRVGFNLDASRRRRNLVAQRATTRAVVVDHRDGASEVAERLAVLDALQSLPPRQRAALVCRHYLDLSVAQTAEVLRCAEGTVRALCHQGSERLRSQLTEHPDVEVMSDER